jgi:hypothetical protein
MSNNNFYNQQNFTNDQQQPWAQPQVQPDPYPFFDQSQQQFNPAQQYNQFPPSYPSNFNVAPPPPPENPPESFSQFSGPGRGGRGGFNNNMSNRGQNKQNRGGKRGGNRGGFQQFGSRESQQNQGSFSQQNVSQINNKKMFN